MLAMTWWNQKKLRKLDGLICDGAVRSGKTVSMVCGFFLWSMSCFSSQTFALCGPTVGALRRNITEHLPQWLGGVFTVREQRSRNRLVVSDKQGRVAISSRSCRAWWGMRLP